MLQWLVYESNEGFFYLVILRIIFNGDAALWKKNAALPLFKNMEERAEKSRRAESCIFTQIISQKNDFHRPALIF